MIKEIEHQFIEARDTLDRFMTADNFGKIEKAGKIMVKALKAGKKIIACGNGGSMSDAMHFAEELTGRFRADRQSIPALAISDASHITCTANDYGFDYIFSRYISGLGNKDDVLLAISTSGNSANVLEAAKVALEQGMKVVSLTGKTGGNLANLSHAEIRAPETQYSDRVQEIHIKVIHTLIHYIEESLF